MPKGAAITNQSFVAAGDDAWTPAASVGASQAFQDSPTSHLLYNPSPAISTTVLAAHTSADGSTAVQMSNSDGTLLKSGAETLAAPADNVFTRLYARDLAQVSVQEIADVQRTGKNRAEQRRSKAQLRQSLQHARRKRMRNERQSALSLATVANGDASYELRTGA